MFVTVLHPFADLRDFVDEQTGRLERPSWPLPNTGIDFVRSSGAVLRRRRGGLREWQGEELYSDGRNAFRFADRLRDIDLGTPELSAHVTRAFRRFNSSGVIARMEIAARIELKPLEQSFDFNHGVAILRNMLLLEIAVRIGKVAPESTSILEAGMPLAAHYLHSTTSRGENAVQPKAWWFTHGVPTVVIDCPESASLLALPHSSLVFESIEAHASVWHSWLQFGNQQIGVWVIKRQADMNADALRRLRVHLLRFHAERECLRLVLQSALGKLKFTKFTPASEAFQQYLNDSIRILEKHESHGVTQSALFDSVHTAVATQYEGELATLIQVRRQVAAKVEAYLKRSQVASTIVNHIHGDQMITNLQLGNATFHGDFTVVTARNIRDSFNKVAGSDAKDDLKEKLKLLTVEVTKLATALSPTQAEHVTNDLGAFVNEATSQNPRKPWYELSGNGLIEAAKTVAEMAAPITTAVRAVLALLA